MIAVTRSVTRIIACGIFMVMLLSSADTPAIAGDNFAVVDPNAVHCLPMVHGAYSFESLINSRDYLYGVNYANPIINNTYGYLDMFFFWRPYQMTTYVEKSDNAYYQVKEKRYIGGIAFDRRQWLNKHGGAYLSIGCGYSYAEYAGTSRIRDEGFIPLAGGGFLIGIMKILYIKIGYQYIDIAHTPPNRLLVAITLDLSNVDWSKVPIEPR